MIARFLPVVPAIGIVMLAGAAAGAQTSSDPQPGSDDRPIRLEWWHSMPAKAGETLEAIAAGFNASQDAYEIVPVDRGSYEASMTAALEAFQAGEQPDILQLSQAATGTVMAEPEAIYPVEELMRAEGAAFDPDDYFEAVSASYTTADGTLLSLPFNASTPILYTNRDAFRQAGLDPDAVPSTWGAVIDAARTITGAGAASCGVTTTRPAWIHVENLSAWHDAPLATRQNGLGGLDAAFDFVEAGTVAMHWANLVAWQNEGLYDYRGRGSDAGTAFGSGECAMLVDASGDRADILARSGFTVGFGPMPHYDGVEGAPAHAMVGGGSLWVLRGQPEDHYPGVARFFAYLSRPDVQADWAKSTGGLPITRAADELLRADGAYRDDPAGRIAIDGVDRAGTDANSKGLRFGHYPEIRDAFVGQLEAALGGGRPARAATEDAQRIGNEMLRQFEKRQR